MHRFNDTPTTEPRPAPGAELVAVIEASCPQDPAICRLFERFFGPRSGDPGLMSELIAMARDPSHSMTLRRLSVLMLENEALTMWEISGFGERSGWLLRELGLLVDGCIRQTVLREGYSSIEPELFARELRTRLARLNRIHTQIAGWNTPQVVLSDFIHVSNLDCKLTLGRYLFQPHETANRIRAQVRTSRGIAPSGSAVIPWHDSTETAVFDETLIDALRRDQNVLWVSSSTPSELNSLIEYPLGTVAMVIKPPGSDREFEVKRTGMRGACLVDVVYERNGVPVPVPHRMQGTSCGSMLEFENSASRNFADIYRGIHGSYPPASRILNRTAVCSVPVEGGEAQILDYLSQPGAFSGDFAKMRDQLKRCVVAYEGDEPREDLPGEIGWTMRFFNRVVPNQAWIEGTTSFRLDRIVTLLSAEGPDSYFRAGLGRDFDWADERRLASEVLEEVLGVVDPPMNAWTGFSTYVADVFAMPANRAAADQAYLGAIEDTGRYWGTLLGTGGFSEGESFVTRNVGLKSYWRAGSWRPQICFMDHDNLHVTASTADPARALRGMRGDDLWVCGDKQRSMMACLSTIYRPSTDLRTRGEDLLFASIKRAFGATRRAMLESDVVGGFFHEGYAQSLVKTDDVVRRYLQTEQSEVALQRWRDEALLTMTETVYSRESLPALLDHIVMYGGLLGKYAFLMEPESMADFSLT